MILKIKFRIWISLLILICLISIPFSYSNQLKQKFNTYGSIPKQDIGLADHLYLLFTAKEYMINNHGNYHNYEKWGSDLDQVIIEVDRVFYSPDRLKMLAWIIFKVPNDLDCSKSGQDHFYSGRGIIGFRENTYELWNVYPFSQLTPVCYGTKEAIQNEFGHYYFNIFKNKAQYVNKKYLNDYYGGELNNRDTTIYGPAILDITKAMISKDFGYNLQDIEFWEKCLIWQKGASIPDYYNFETRVNYLERGEDVDLNSLKIDYPDYILDMFKMNNK